MPILPNDRFLVYRYMSYVAVVTSLFGAALMFLLGVTKTVRAYITFLSQFDDPLEHYPQSVDQAIALLVQAIDSFLIGMVFIIFSYGVTTLFVRRIELPEGSVFSWVRITNIKNLKVILGELIVIILSVKFLEVVLLNAAEFSYEMLVLPVGVVLLALALKLLTTDRK